MLWSKIETDPVVDAIVVQSSAPLTVPDTFRALAEVFSDIKARGIRQESGGTQNNAGEMFPTGVTAMLFQMGPLGNHDVFLDIGAGIGNVLAQVALTTKVGKCIGVEVRYDLCSLPVQHIRRHAVTYPLLRKV